MFNTHYLFRINVSKHNADLNIVTASLQTVVCLVLLAGLRCSLLGRILAVAPGGRAVAVAAFMDRLGVLPVTQHPNPQHILDAPILYSGQDIHLSTARRKQCSDVSHVSGTEDGSGSDPDTSSPAEQCEPPGAHSGLAPANGEVAAVAAVAGEQGEGGLADHDRVPADAMDVDAATVSGSSSKSVQPTGMAGMGDGNHWGTIWDMAWMSDSGGDQAWDSHLMQEDGEALLNPASSHQQPSSSLLRLAVLVHR